LGKGRKRAPGLPGALPGKESCNYSSGIGEDPRETGILDKYRAVFRRIEAIRPGGILVISRILQVRASQVRVAQVCLAQPSAVKISMTEVARVKVGAEQVGACKLRISKICQRELRGREIGIRGVATVQSRTAQIRKSKICTGKLRMTKIRTRKDSSLEACASQFGIREIRLRHRNEFSRFRYLGGGTSKLRTCSYPQRHPSS